MLTLMLLLSLLSFEPCEQEDSSACYWNAQTMGNGQGHSFIAVTDTFTIYL